MSSLIDRFSKEAEERSNGAGYLKINENESAIIRFLSPLVDNYELVHTSAGCACHIEMPRQAWESYRGSTGENPMCPICGKPFADQDVIGVKEGARGGGFHYIEGSGYLLCLDDPDNNHPYQCPLCLMQVEKTRRSDNSKYMAPNTPQNRMCAYAVLRTAKKDRGTDGRGLPTEEIVGIEDEMVERNGVMVPNVVIVDQAWSNFWASLTHKGDDFCDPITYYDYEVKRTGKASYQITKIQRPAEIVSIDRYKPYMTRTLAEHVLGKGTPQYYTGRGVYVAGYTPDAGATPGYTPSTLAGCAQNTLSAAAQPYAAPAAQPYAAPAAQPYAAPVVAQQPYSAQTAPQGNPYQASAPQAAPASQGAPNPYMPQPIGAAPAPQAAPQGVPQGAPQGAPAATVPWTDTASSIGASVYDKDIPF